MLQSNSISNASGAVPESPFENTEHVYLLLNNGSNKHSLWPERCSVPVGWAVVYGPATREECLKEVK